MNLVRPGPALTVGDIEAFEQEIGSRLPDDYKRFLLASNGGMTEPCVGFRWNGKINKVPGFYELLPDSRSGLRRGISDLRELRTDGLLPITSTQNDEDICLDFADKIGTIRLALPIRDNYVRVGVTLFRLAGSFTEFLSQLFPIPEVYCPIYEMGKDGTVADLQAYLSEGNSIDALGKHGFSIMCEAIKFDNMAIFHACLERGASFHKSVYIAAGNRRPDLIRLLASAGADVNEQDEYGHTPLHCVGGWALPGAEGALNRELRDVLIVLGAVDM